MRHVEFVQQAVCVGLTNLAHVVTSGDNTTVGIGSAPIKFKLLFEVVFIAVVHICKVAVCFLHTRCAVHHFVNGVHSAVGQVIGGCRMALPHVAVVQIGGVDTKLARFAYAIYVVECGVVRAVEIIKTLVYTRSRRFHIHYVLFFLSSSAYRTGRSFRLYSSISFILGESGGMVSYPPSSSDLGSTYSVFP